MDETRVCYTEYSKSEKQILFTIAHNMESKKMVLMKLFAGQRGDTDRENRLEDVAGAGRKERVGCMERVPWKHMLPYVKWRASGVCCMTGNSNQGSVMTWRGGVGRPTMRERMRTPGWLLLMFGSLRLYDSC